MTLRLVTGNIVTQQAEVIVNAANSSLLGGGGVDGAIHAAGGPVILAECRKIRATTHHKGLPTGQAVATTAGDLPARWVVHTVGPIYRQGTRQQLCDAYTNSLQCAAELGARTIAFPLLSAGAYSWPIADAARCALESLASPPADFDVISLMVFTPELAEVVRAQAEDLGVTLDNS